MYVFKITFNVFKKKGWSYIQVISLSHLNNAIFFTGFLSSFHPFLPYDMKKNIHQYNKPGPCQNNSNY